MMCLDQELLTELSTIHGIRLKLHPLINTKELID